ncbi:MAG TPA: DUF4349 domain-containing protein [Actinomycetota bacterium]|nr:DUF4349 domain-containing protein [Actinomycetota bacterium]
MRRIGRGAGLLAGVAAVAIAAVACSSSGGGAQSAGALTAATSGAAGVTGTSGVSGGSAPAGTSGGGGATVVDVPAVPQAIVKNARLSLEVPRNGFEKAADQATAIAGAEGGYVESSSSHGSNVASGRLTLRIPVDNFEAALSEVSRLGAVRLRSVTGRDVTSKFVDLDARIRNAKAQEVVLLGILNDAKTVSATLQVQRTLSDVQLQIEELVGQERSLRNRADLGTIVVDLFEPGLPAHHAVVTAGISNPSLAEAWTRAKATFFGLLYAIVVSAGVLLPLGLVALVVFLVWRRWRDRARSVPAEARPDA